MVMSDSRYTDACCFYYAFGNGELFFEDRDDCLPAGMRGCRVDRAQFIKGRIHSETSRGDARMGVRYLAVTSTEIRRLSARPSSVELSATGLWSPYPLATRRSCAIPMVSNWATTLLARS